MNRLDWLAIAISLLAIVISLWVIARGYDAQLTQCSEELHREFREHSACRINLDLMLRTPRGGCGQ